MSVAVLFATSRADLGPFFDALAGKTSPPVMVIVTTCVQALEAVSKQWPEADVKLSSASRIETEIDRLNVESRATRQEIEERTRAYGILGTERRSDDVKKMRAAGLAALKKTAIDDELDEWPLTDIEALDEEFDVFTELDPVWLNVE